MRLNVVAWYLPTLIDMPADLARSNTRPSSAPPSEYIERMIVENRAPYPAERTLLTSGMTLAAVESLHSGQIVPAELPERPSFYAREGAGR